MADDRRRTEENNQFVQVLGNRKGSPAQPTPTEESPARTGGRERHVGGQFDEQVSVQLKIIAAKEKRSILDLVAEGLNHVFEVRGLPPIASTKRGK